MNRDIRFCTTEDGVRIAYCVEGEGPDFVFCPEFVGSFSLDHLIEDQMGFWRALRRGRRVVRYDMRGTGLSQRGVEDVSHDAVTRDLEAVVRASGARQFTLYASGLSGPRAIAYAARHRRLVRRLVLQGTFARAADLMTAEQIRNFADLARLNWARAAQGFADLSARAEHPDASVHAAHLYEQSTSGDVVARLLTQGLGTDVRPLLPRIRVPTLIVHWSDDPTFSLRLAQELAAAIPQARLAPLRQGIMSYLAAGQIEEVVGLLNEFIDDGAEVVAGSAPQGVGQAAPAPRPLAAEATITVHPQPQRSFASGRYVLKRILGEGAQKSVYLVHDTTLDRECALALVKSDLAEPEDILRIRREAQTMARLGSRTNIVTVHDLGEEDGRPYIVCEYVPGGDLRAELRAAGGPLATERAVAIATDVARALVVAHGRGVVHRDLKPSNVLMNDDGSGKLGDFGIAFSVDRSRMTMAGTLMGTAAYLAPEQALGQQVDARSDLYSLGAMLYELVTGRTPFPGEDAMRVVAQHINASPTRPSVHNATLPEALDGLILRLLAKEPDERPASAAAVIGELDRIAQDLQRGRRLTRD